MHKSSVFLWLQPASCMNAPAEKLSTGYIVYDLNLRKWERDWCGNSLPNLTGDSWCVIVAKCWIWCLLKEVRPWNDGILAFRMFISWRRKQSTAVPVTAFSFCFSTNVYFAWPQKNWGKSNASNAQKAQVLPVLRSLTTRKNQRELFHVSTSYLIRHRLPKPNFRCFLSPFS